MTDSNAAILANETLTPAELQGLLRASRSSIYRAIENGSIPHFTINRRVLIPTNWIRNLLMVAA